MTTHDLMGGELHVYKRPRSGVWQCSTFLAGKNWRISTREESLAKAKDFAEDWFLGLKGKDRYGELKGGKTFGDAVRQFLKEYPVITQGQRNPDYVAGHELRLNVHLLPFFGEDTPLSMISEGRVMEYRVHRAQTSKTGKPPSRSTMSHEIVTLRQVLKTAHRHRWIPYAENRRANQRLPMHGDVGRTLADSVIAVSISRSLTTDLSRPFCVAIGMNFRAVRKHYQLPSTGPATIPAP